MITSTLLAAVALARIQTLPAYGEYRAAVEACRPPVSWSEKQKRELRTAFRHARPDRHVTRAVEQEIAEDAVRMRACLDAVATTVQAAATSSAVAAAFGPQGAAPWLTDIARRKAAAEREIRGYFIEAGYRRSNARAKPVQNAGNKRAAAAIGD